MRLALALALVLIALPSLAQDDLAARRAALEAHPEDRSARCSLAFALVAAESFAEARDTATPAIDGLRPSTDRASLRLLGACLYNRGRAYEGLADRQHAIVDYAESIEVRDDDRVRERLETLVPRVPADAPLVAIAAAANVEWEIDDAASTTRRTRDGVRWAVGALSADDDGLGSTVVVAARLCGIPVTTTLDSTLGMGHEMHVDGVTTRRLGDVDALIAVIGGSDHDWCSDDERCDDVFTETAVVFADGCELRRAIIRTSSSDGTHGYDVRVRFDATGNAIVTRVGGSPPPSALGSFRIRDLAQLP